MKKFLLVCVAFAAVTLFSNSASAQVKIGYFDEQAALSLFPGIAKIDTLLNSYRIDSLQEEYKYNVSDFQRRDSIFKKDSATMPAKAREMATRELLQLRYKLVNWQEYSQQMEQAKYEELIYPFKAKLFEAIQAIIAEQKYTLILKSDALAQQYMQPNILDNVTIRVAQKLKLPLPKEIEDAWKAASGSSAAPAKPAAKPAGKG
ncbi:MAG: OmpH family outer membrane protein [Sediminibacterium sp.]